MLTYNRVLVGLSNIINTKIHVPTHYNPFQILVPAFGPFKKQPPSFEPLSKMISCFGPISKLVPNFGIILKTGS